MCYGRLFSGNRPSLSNLFFFSIASVQSRLQHKNEGRNLPHGQHLPRLRQPTGFPERDEDHGCPPPASPVTRFRRPSGCVGCPIKCLLESGEFSPVRGSGSPFFFTNWLAPLKPPLGRILEGDDRFPICKSPRQCTRFETRQHPVPKVSTSRSVNSKYGREAWNPSFGRNSR